MRYLSICSGIEAASVAWAPLGWTAVGFSEIEPFPCAVLAERFPLVPNFGDMTRYEDWPTAIRPDIIIGGTPCQSFSVAGLRKGLEDPRGNLMLVFLGILERYRPGWVVWENVPGVLSVDGGRAFGAFLGGLGKLGYGFAYRVLDAQYFGLAQRRKRVFVVGHFGDWRRAAAVLFEPESLRGDSAPSREAGKGIAPTLRASSSPRGHGHSHGLRGDGQDCLIPELSMSPNAHPGGRCDGESETFIHVAHSLRGEGFDASEDGTGRGTPLVPVAIQGTMIGRNDGAGPQGSGYDDSGAMFTLTKTDVHAIAFEPRFARNGRGAPDEVIPPLKAQSGSTGKGDAAPCVASATAVRRLTPRECERLQGFPNDFTRIPWRGKAAEDCPDGPRYKALGNSMAVPVVRWIGERIRAVHEIPEIKS